MNTLKYPGISPASNIASGVARSVVGSGGGGNNGGGEVLATALTYNGHPITFNGQNVTYTAS